jgi:hypothetical protein
MTGNLLCVLTLYERSKVLGMTLVEIPSVIVHVTPHCPMAKITRHGHVLGVS